MARTGSARAGRRGRAPRPTRGRRTGNRRGNAPTRRAPSRGLPAGTAAVALAEEAAGMRDPKPLSGVVLEPAKSSKSQPFGIVATGPRGSMRATRPRSPRTRKRSRPLGARRHARRPRRSSPSPRTATLSARRCGCATIESRRSASQRAPVAFCTAAPTRWMESGGDVVITASIACSRTSRIAAGIAVTLHRDVLVGYEQPAAQQPGLGHGTLEPFLARQLLRGAFARSDRRSGLGAPMPDSAPEDRDRRAPSGDRRARGHASRSRAQGGTARA